MKVLFFQRIFAHYQWGLVQELAENGEHEYSFLGDTKDPGGSGIEVIPLGKLQKVNFRRVRTWQIGRRIAFQPAAVQAAVQASYDVLILEGAYAHPTAWAAINAAHVRGKRVLLYTHGWTRRVESNWVAAVRLRFLRSADGLLLYGRRAKEIGIASGVAAQKMYVAFNSLDQRTIDVCRSAVADAGLAAFRLSTFGDPQLPIVTCVGRVRKRKAFEAVLAAMRRLNDRGVRSGLLVIGGGRAVSDLREASSRLGIPAHFTGPVYDEQRLAVMLSASRVVIAPEAVGLTAVHAMSYGVPVVTHSEFDHQGPEAEAIVPGVTGDFFLRGDEINLAEKLSVFLGPNDPRALWAPACMRMVERWYNPKHMRRTFDRAVSGLPAEQQDVWPALSLGG